MAVAQVCTPQVRVIECGVAKVTGAKIYITEVRAAEAGPAQAGCAQVRSGQGERRALAARKIGAA